MLEQFPNDVKYVVKHFPLSNHQFAHRGAMAALAAGNQGKFWEFHSRLLENHDQVSEEKIQEIAAALGLNLDQFNQDSRSPVNRELIQADILDGRKTGVRGTPSVFMNGKRIGNRELGRLPELIQGELSE